MQKVKSRHRLLRWPVMLLLLLVVALVAFRIALPFLVQDYVNKKLDEIPEYDGHIGDVDIRLWEGAYEIEDIDIVKTNGDVPAPFFSAKRVKFSVEWRALFDGAWVGEIEFESPVMNFVKGPTASQTQVGLDKPWLDVIQKLFPLDINRFEVHDGTIHYRDFHSAPPVDLKIDQVHLLGKNLTNSEDRAENLPATIDLNGRLFEQGEIKITSKVNPFSHEPTFDIDLQTSRISLTRLNDFSRAYANFDFEKGTLDVAAELAAKEGSLNGYVKPLFDDVAIVDLKENVKNPAKLFWEGLVGTVSRLFRNQPKDRFATKIPIKGSVGKPDTLLWPTVANIFRNAFIQAYQGDIENIIDLEAGKTAE